MPKTLVNQTNPTTKNLFKNNAPEEHRLDRKAKKSCSLKIQKTKNTNLLHEPQLELALRQHSTSH